jgi:hypothetical protein
MSFGIAKVFGRAKPTDWLGRMSSRITAHDKRFAAELMHQQCWCWGQDIRLLENLLLKFGGIRHRAPACPGSSRYEFANESPNVSSMVCLWGFGFWLKLPSGECGYFSRYRRGVWLLPMNFDVSQIHNATEIEPHIRRPISARDFRIALRLSVEAASWCERYEAWVVEQQGITHRSRTLDDWEHPVVEAGDMVTAWRRVRGIYQTWYRKGRFDAGIESALSKMFTGHVERPSIG